jgi:hypothetical protein
MKLGCASSLNKDKILKFGFTLLEAGQFGTIQELEKVFQCRVKQVQIPETGFTFGIKQGLLWFTAR